MNGRDGHGRTIDGTDEKGKSEEGGLTISLTRGKEFLEAISCRCRQQGRGGSRTDMKRARGGLIDMYGRGGERRVGKARRVQRGWDLIKIVVG